MTKNKLVLPITYLGAVSYYALMQYFDIVYIETKENYIKQTDRTRTVIASANGALQLTIPVSKRSGLKIPITDVEISYAEPWHKVHWQAIVSAYNSSPFFEYYADEIEELYLNQTEKLLDFNIKLQDLLIELFQIEANIRYTDQFIKVYDDDTLDLRYTEPSILSLPEYRQVFDDRHGFMSNMSCIDLLCNLGPESAAYFDSLITTQFFQV